MVTNVLLKIPRKAKSLLSFISSDRRQSKLEQDQLWSEISKRSSVKSRAKFSGKSSVQGMGLVSSSVLVEQIPQARVTENAYSAYEAADWRSHFASRLSGKGLEIGPLHRPMIRHDKMEIDYIDRCTVAELREHYPELRDLPLVEPDIIGDAQSLDNIEAESYDFVISAHVIEHMRNPIKAMKEWVRVLKPRGLIYMIVPDKRAIFDRPRVLTNLEHLILDYQRPSLVRDYEHFLDYAVHVHGKKGEAAIRNADELVESDYSIHFHVFLPSDILRMCQWFSENVFPIKVKEGPIGAPHSDEFHLLIEKGYS